MTQAAAIDPVQTHQVLEQKHARPLVACKWDPLARYVFFGAEDNLVHRYDIASKVVTPLARHDSWVRALGCSPDGVTLYSGGYDGRLMWWPAAAEKPEPVRVVDAHQGWLRALAVSPDGSKIATCGNDKFVKLWNAADGAPLGQFAGHESHVYNVAWRPDGSTLVSCDLKGVAKEWDLATGTAKRDLAAAPLWKYDTTFRADIGGARSLAFRGDGNQVALGGITNVSNAFAGIGHPAAVLLEWADGKQAFLLEPKEKANGVCWGLAHHPQGFWIALAGGGGGGFLYFFKGDAANQFHQLKLPNNGRDLSVSPDGTRVAVAHADSHLRIYALHAKASA
jgi:WD40 repeat protein